MIAEGTFPVNAVPGFHLLAKPAGAACNLSCKYCFFLSKENLYAERESPLMDEATLDSYIRQLFESSAGSGSAGCMAGRRADAARPGLLPAFR